MTETQQETVAVLNHLLAAEMNSLLPRLLEMNLSVSWTAAPILEVVKKLAVSAREHREWLVDAIQDHKGAVRPVSLDPRTANLHYLSLDAIAPLLVRHLRQLVLAYQQAGSQKNLSPEAAELISRITDRYQKTLQQLESLTGSTIV